MWHEFPAPFMNIFVKPTDEFWECAALTDTGTDIPRLATDLFTGMVLLANGVDPEMPPMVPFDIEADEIIPVATNVLCGEYTRLRIFEHVVG